MNQSGNDAPDEQKNVMMEAYRRLQAKAKQAQMDVNSQVAQGGEQFMSPEESQANADFLTNQIGEGAISGGIQGANLPSAVEQGTAQLAQVTGGKMIRPNTGFGGIVNAPAKAISEAETMAANAKPNLMKDNAFKAAFLKKFGR